MKMKMKTKSSWPSGGTPRGAPPARLHGPGSIGAFAAFLLTAFGAAAGAQDLTVRLQDWVQMPISGDLSVVGNPAYLTRVNFLREEPGNTGRMWACDLNGNLYIFPKAGNFGTRSAPLLALAQANTSYLDFNGQATTGTATEKAYVPNATGSTTQTTPNGLFKNFTKQSGYANGLVCFQFDPGYAQNGKFYTVHIEMNSTDGNASRLPTAGAGTKHPGFNATGYTSTNVVAPPVGNISRQAVLIEWTDTNPGNTSFEGTARELLRVGFLGSIHPLGDLIFNPLATGPSHPDWGALYVAIGDGGAGESNSNDDGTAGVTGGDRHYFPQRLDLLLGKTLRLVPDLALHLGSSTVSANGRYRIPTDNPFVNTAGARGEIWTFGHRNPHRLSWDAATNQLLTCEIGLHAWEEINVLTPGRNYGYGEREGGQRLIISNGSDNQTLGAVPSPDTLPLRVGAASGGSPVTPTYPAAAYPHTAPFGDAISSGFVYRGTLIPELQGKFVFGDITTGRLFFCDFNELLAANTANGPASQAAIHNLFVQWDGANDAPGALQSYLRMFEVVKSEYQFRYQQATGFSSADLDLPGGSTISGTGRADIRLQVDAGGELFVISKSDGVIRALRPAVSQAVVLVQQPVSLVVAAGQAATFSVVASGSPAPSGYQWQRLPTGSGTWSEVSNGTAYAGATTGTLTVGVTTAGMNGDQFRCVVTNGVSPAAISQPATLLTASSASVITQSPGDSTTASGRVVVLAAAAFGNPAPAYTWQRAAAATPAAFSNLANGTTFAGTATATLTIAATPVASGSQALGSGDRFRCVATNSVSSANSNAATLTIITAAAPGATDPADQTVLAPQSTTFTVAATGSPTLTYLWQRAAAGSATFLAVNNEGAHYSGVTTATLTVSGTTTAMSGDRWRCVVGNTVGKKTTAAATLTVQQAPLFTTQPDAQQAAYGQDATFTVAASGNPAPTYQWQRRPAAGGIWANVTNGGAYAGAVSPTLTVSGLTTAMSGDEFRCLAANGVPSDAMSNSAMLTLATQKASWRTAHFTPAQLADAATSGDSADPDGDGLDNAFEYRFDLDPLANSRHLLPRAELSGNGIRLTFQAPRSELDYVAQGCTDLQSWSPSGVTMQTNGTQITATYLPPGGGRGFLRVFVSPKP